MAKAKVKKRKTPAAIERARRHNRRRNAKRWSKRVQQRASSGQSEGTTGARQWNMRNHRNKKVKGDSGHLGQTAQRKSTEVNADKGPGPTGHDEDTRKSMVKFALEMEHGVNTTTCERQTPCVKCL